MVGKRDFAGPNGFADTVDNKFGDRSGKVELGKPRPRPKIFKYQDDEGTAAEEDQKREQLKNQLLNGTERNTWEKFRKSKEEVCISRDI